MKVAIYSRKSVYTGRGESIENQIADCKEYISRDKKRFPVQDLETDIYVFKDEGFSGKNLNRPQFKEMMGLIRQKKVQCVVCYRIDRISRNVGDFALLINELNALGVSFFSVSEQFECSTSMGHAMMLMSSVFSQLERETIAERIRDNYYRLAQTGRWLGGIAPLGYRTSNITYETIDDKKKSCSYLVLAPEESKIVKLIFNKYLEYRSLKKVAEYLHDKEITSREGNPFTGATVREILMNPVYCQADQDIYQYFNELGTTICMDADQFNGQYGLVSNYRRDHSKKNAPRLPMKDWMVSVGKHCGILSGKEWILVLQYLDANKKKITRTATNRNEYALLSGKIICKQCGSRMFAKKSSYQDCYYYICGGKRSEAEITRGYRCTSENLPGKEMDKFILEQLSRYIDNIEDWAMVLERLTSDHASSEREVTMELLRKEIAEKNEEFQRYTDRLLDNNFNEALMQEINKRTETLHQQIVAAERALEVLLESVQKNYNCNKVEQELFATAVRYLSSNLGELTMEEKRELIDLFVERIEWDGEILQIFMYGQY